MMRSTFDGWITRALLSCACVALHTHIAGGQAARSQTPTDVAALSAADSALHAAVASHDAGRTASFYDDSATMLPSGEAMVVGRDAVRQSWERVLAIPGFTNVAHLESVIVSRSGDMAYTRGRYEASFSGADGKPIALSGRWLTVWKKTASGAWKIAADAYDTVKPAS